MGFLKKLTVPFLLVMLATGAGCAVSEAQVADNAAVILDRKLAEEPVEHNVEENSAFFHLPDHLEMEKMDDYNYMLLDGKQVYLLFLNDNASFETTGELSASLSPEEAPVVAELSGERNEQGYIVISQADETEYNVITGYNGIKLTSVMPIEKVPEQAEMMFDIVYSVQLKD